jgi:hypothetical protein
MKLIEINKERYRKHLNIVIVGFISSLLVFSLAFGTILINLFSSVNEIVLAKASAEGLTDAVADGKTSNFKYNFLGVLLALLANAAILHSVKSSAFFKEIYYVWQIKQLQNLIYRKLTKIKAAARSGEEIALIILSFYYQSQLQVYKLDDNTITLSTIEKDLQQLNDVIADKGLNINAASFEKSLLLKYN